MESVVGAPAAPNIVAIVSVRLHPLAFNRTNCASAIVWQSLFEG